MGNVVITILLGLVTNCLSFYAEKGIKAFSERKEQEQFKRKIEAWCDNFIRENETTVVSGDAFADYLNYYNLIANFFDFIISPNGETEDSFLKRCEDNVKEYYKDKKSLSYDDSRSIKDFIHGVFDIIKTFYVSKTPTEFYGLNYELSQLTAITKRTCDSNEEMVSVVKKTQEGIETIIEILSNNSVKKTIPSKIVFKKTYQMPQNTINRTIAKYKELQEGFYLSIQPENIIEACIREKKIVLLGEAGSGKSIVVQQTAAMACNTQYYPIIYNLNYYIGESLESIINKEYEGVDHKNLFIIFDSFDEIKEEYKDVFSKRIRAFSNENPETIIFISSRSNFYSFSDNDLDNGLFDGFKEYGIYPLSILEIENYIERQGVNVKKFIKEIRKNDLYDLIFTPFYLKELVSIYLDSPSLPKKSVIIEKIVDRRFVKDVTKYLTSENIEDDEYEVFKNLEKLAFSLQTMQQIRISNYSYQQLFEKCARKLIKYTGVFAKKNKKSWEFEHNIFREFFAAKYLNRFDKQTIKEIVCYSDGRINESWTNVVSFLILIRKDDDILVFISENDIEMLVKFERSRVDESKRTEIVINILSDLARKNVWLSHGRNSASGLANFGQSVSLCDFLLDQINNPVNFRALSNAISVLSEFSTLFGKDVEIKNVLFNCVKSVSNREYERIRALDAIVSLNLQDEEITSYVVNELCLGQNNNLRLAKLKYLNSLSKFEDYIDVFADEFSKGNTNGMFELRHESLIAFSKMRKVQSLCRIVHLLSRCGEAFSFDLDVYDIVIEKSVEHYFFGNTEIFDSFIDIIPNAMIINRSFFNKCVEFFEKTKTKAIASLRLVEKYLKNDDMHLIFAIIKIADDESHSLLLEKFGEEPQKYKKAVEPIANYTYRLTNVYKNHEAELETHGINIVKPDPSFDHSEAMKRGRQYCFDCLFEREKFIELLKKMIEKTNNANITFSEFSKLNFDPVNYNSPDNKNEEYAQLEIAFFLGNSDSKRSIVETIEALNNWDQFIIDFSCRLLVAEESIEVSETQRQFFEKYCNDLISILDLDNEITDTENGGVSYSKQIYDFAFLSEHFDFVYEKAIFRKMLVIPNCLFPSYKANLTDKLPTYITNYLSKEELNDQVQINMSEMKMCSFAADAHIEYCRDNGFDWAVNVAETICSNEKLPSWRKRTSIDYLIKIKGIDYVYDKYLQTDDQVLLDEIVSLTREYKDERLIKRLESVNRKSKDGKKYLKTLVYLGSKYGFRRYYETIKSAMKSNVEIEESFIDSVPDIISCINDIDLLDIINDLRKLLFSEGFVDDDYYNLFNGLYNAYSNMAKENYPTIKKCLEEALENKNISDNEKSFCYSLLMTIDKSYYQSKNKAWTVSEIKEFWDKHPI